MPPKLYLQRCIRVKVTYTTTTAILEQHMVHWSGFPLERRVTELDRDHGDRADWRLARRDLRHSSTSWVTEWCSEVLFNWTLTWTECIRFWTMWRLPWSDLRLQDTRTFRIIAWVNYLHFYRGDKALSWGHLVQGIWRLVGRSIRLGDTPTMQIIA